MLPPFTGVAVNVTGVPAQIDPVGATEIFTDGFTGVIVFLKTETVFAFQFGTTSSGLLSPSISPMASPKGPVPVVKSIFALNDIVPLVPVFLKIETELDE